MWLARMASRIIANPLRVEYDSTRSATIPPRLWLAKFKGFYAGRAFGGNRNDCSIDCHHSSRLADGADGGKTGRLSLQSAATGNGLHDVRGGGDLTENKSNLGLGWFYVSHSRIGGAQLAAHGQTNIVPLGANCVLSDGSARWFSYAEDSSGNVLPNSECEACVRVPGDTDPGFFWGKPDVNP